MSFSAFNVLIATIAVTLTACATSTLVPSKITNSLYPRYETDNDLVIIFFGDSLKYGNVNMGVNEFLSSEFGETLTYFERPLYGFFMRSNGVFPVFRPKGENRNFQEANYKCTSTKQAGVTYYICEDLSKRILKSAHRTETGIIWFDWYCAGISYEVCRYELKSGVGILL